MKCKLYWLFIVWVFAVVCANGQTQSLQQAASQIKEDFGIVNQICYDDKSPELLFPRMTERYHSACVSAIQNPESAPEETRWLASINYNLWRLDTKEGDLRASIPFPPSNELPVKIAAGANYSLVEKYQIANREVTIDTSEDLPDGRYRVSATFPVNVDPGSLRVNAANGSKFTVQITYNTTTWEIDSIGISDVFVILPSSIPVQIPPEWATAPKIPIPPFTLQFEGHNVVRRNEINSLWQARLPLHFSVNRNPAALGFTEAAFDFQYGLWNTLNRPGVTITPQGLQVILEPTTPIAPCFLRFDSLDPRGGPFAVIIPIDPARIQDLQAQAAQKSILQSVTWRIWIFGTITGSSDASFSQHYLHVVPHELVLTQVVEFHEHLPDGSIQDHLVAPEILGRASF